MLNFTKKLTLDFETFSIADLKAVGLDNYAKHPSTRVLMLSWKVDNGPTRLWEPDLEPMPLELRALLNDPTVLVVAWNAAFEFNIFLHVLGIHIPFSRWRDAAVWSRYLSMPGSLEQAGVVVGLSADKAKSKEGKRLIQLFSYPAKIKKLTKKQIAEGLVQPTGLVRNNRNSHPEDWKLFCDYCIQDTEAEHTLDTMFENFPLPESEQLIWELDQKMNFEGMPANLLFVQNALRMAEDAKAEAIELLKFKTGLANPNSNVQVLEWVRERGYPFTSLNKSFVKRALEDPKWGGVTVKPDVEFDEDGETDDFEDLIETKEEAVENTYTAEQAIEAKEVLNIRLAASKISYKKLEKISLSISADGRVRNQFLFLGASRTGRWSGRNVQLQNLKRPDSFVKKNMDKAIELILANDYERAKKAFEKVGIMEMITSCIRAAFQAPPGFKFVVCDLNAIENRVLGWLAGCEAILDVFRRGGCPYLDFAARRTGRSYEELKALYDAGDEDVAQLRQLYKPPVLGAGYGLGPGKQVTRKGNLMKTGLWGYAENMGVSLTREECVASIAVYRQDFVEVVALWGQLEQAARDVLAHGKPIRVGPVVFKRKVRKNGQNIMIIELPSGRNLHYLNARVQRVPAKIREWTDKETGIEVQGVGVYCTDCRATSMFKKFATRTEDKDPAELARDSMFDDIVANSTVVRECRTCKTDTVWHRGWEESLMYDGVGHGVGAIGAGWGPVYTYGGKLTENIVQAIARDILVNGMRLADERGFTILGCFHDEILAMVKNTKFGIGLAELRACMSETPSWAPGLPLAAEGYEGSYYKK